MTNKQVVEAWIEGREGKSKNMSTDGLKLYSYQLEIGCTFMKTSKWVYNYTGKRRRCKCGFSIESESEYISQTTSMHVNLALKQADHISTPTERRYKQ